MDDNEQVTDEQPTDEQPTWSRAAPLMERTVCPLCTHMHRAALANKCRCCREDDQ